MPRKKMEINISTDQIIRLKNLYPKIMTGTAKDRNARIEMIVLHNDIFGSNYNPNSGCSRCLSTCYAAIKKLYKQYGN